MEGLVKEIDGVLNQFLKDGVGGPVTQWNMKGLRMVITQIVLSYKPTKEGVKKEDVKK